MTNDYCTSKRIAGLIVDKINQKEFPWVQVFTGTLRRIGDWEVPTPDFVFEESCSGKTYAMLFSDSGRDMNAHLDLIDLAVAVLSRHDYCCLILPNMDLGHLVGTEVEAKIYERNLDGLAISLVEYERGLLCANPSNAIALARPLPQRVTVSISKSRTENKSYWCWWRDTSKFEVFQLLELSHEYETEEGDIYSKSIYPRFYEMMTAGETLQWDGSPRRKLYSLASYRAEKQNNKIPLTQLGLWDAKEGRLTEKGKRLLSLGQVCGPESDEFNCALAKTVLVDGKHLDLIRDVVEFQKSNRDIIPARSEDFFLLLEYYLTDKDSIGTRKPTAVKTGAKKSYLRDEPKLWNKLGLVHMQSPQRYYRPFVGIEFNWNAIDRVLLFDW